MCLTVVLELVWVRIVAELISKLKFMLSAENCTTKMWYELSLTVSGLSGPILKQRAYP